MTIEYRYMRKAAPDVREDGTLHGRAWPYNSTTMIGKLPYGFRETILPGAGKKSINDGDIVLLDNHEHRLPLARMSAGTLEMKDGSDGGDWVATPANTSYAKDVVQNVRAGNYGGCSFGFEVIRDKWTDDQGNPADPTNGTNREIQEMKVHEISVCTFPAYSATSVSSRAMVMTARGIEDERMGSSMMPDVMQMSPHSGTSNSGGDVGWDPDGDGDDDSTASGDTDHSHWDAEGNQIKPVPGKPLNGVSVAVSSDRSKPTPVPYADPGYQPDKKRRYPLDTENHVKASWSYIGQEKNAAKYNATQVASIKTQIKTAMHKNGVGVSDEKKADEWAMLCDFREMTEGYTPEGDLNDVTFGVLPGGFVRAEDANTLAKAIKNAFDGPTRVAAIDLAVNLSLPDMLPDHWGPAGEIGSAAGEEACRDMRAVYDLAIDLPPTRLSLGIIQRAEPYLSNQTIEEANTPDPGPELEEFDPEVMRQLFQEARDRLHAIDKSI